MIHAYMKSQFIDQDLLGDYFFKKKKGVNKAPCWQAKLIRNRCLIKAPTRKVSKFASNLVFAFY